MSQANNWLSFWLYLDELSNNIDLKKVTILLSDSHSQKARFTLTKLNGRGQLFFFLTYNTKLWSINS